MYPIIIDTETTGLKNPKACEVAYIRLHPELSTFKLDGLVDFEGTDKFFNKRFNPGKPIELGASKITGIYDSDVRDCDPIDTFELPEHTFFIAHNAIFDHRVLGYPETTVICTKEIAQIALNGREDLRNHKLSTLVEYLYPEDYKEMLVNSHGAMVDCILTAHVLRKLLDLMPHINSWEQLGKLCNQPKDFKTITLDKMPFGKYKNERFENIPKEYLVWLYKQNPSIAIKNSIEKALSVEKKKWDCL